MSQVIVITGLAQGMGRQVAVLLAKEGYTIAGFDMDGQSLASLRKELDTLGSSHSLHQVDITDRSGILKFRDDVLYKFQKVDTVLSNIGIGFFGPFEEIDLEKALTCFEINVIGAAAIFQAFIPCMRERNSGKLIAMSSLVGQIPFPFESIYTASKFALEGLVEAIKYEVTPFGIKVALIEPAQVSTGFAAKIHRLPPDGSVYRDRVTRFIKRDEELIQKAPSPLTAAKRIVKVILSENPRLRNQVDGASTFFLLLNRFLPKRLRDAILLRHMNIEV